MLNLKQFPSFELHNNHNNNDSNKKKNINNNEKLYYGHNWYMQQPENTSWLSFLIQWTL